MSKDLCLFWTRRTARSVQVGAPSVCVLIHTHIYKYYLIRVLFMRDVYATRYGHEVTARET